MLSLTPGQTDQVCSKDVTVLHSCEKRFDFQILPDVCDGNVIVMENRLCEDR